MKSIVIGSSTGGPRALETIIERLPSNLRAVVIVVQHISDDIARSMAKRLNGKYKIPISIVEDGQSLSLGGVYIVPGASHFFMISPEESDGEVKAKLLPAHENPSPSVDMAFTSVAEHFGEDTIAVILTGMGNDGTIGAKAIKQFGGIVIAQDEDTSAVFGMPKSVAEKNLVDFVLPLERIAPKLIYLVNNT